MTTEKPVYLAISTFGGWGKNHHPLIACLTALMYADAPGTIKLYKVSEDATFDGATVEGRVVKKISEDAMSKEIQKKFMTAFDAEDMDCVQYDSDADTGRACRGSPPIPKMGKLA